MKFDNHNFGLTLIGQFEFAALVVSVYYLLATDEVRAIVQGFADEPAEGDCATALPALERGMRVLRQQVSERCLLDLSKLRSLEHIGMAILESACAELHDRGTQICFVVPEKCKMTDEVAGRLSLLSGEDSRVKETLTKFTLTA